MFKQCVQQSEHIVSPIYVDVTYNLTSMYALILTFRAMEFEHNPLMIGPILLTNKTKTEDLQILWQELSKMHV